MALALLDVVLAIALGAFALGVWRARRREARSCVDLALTGPYLPGTRARTAWAFGMSAWVLGMALLAVVGAVGAAR